MKVKDYIRGDSRTLNLQFNQSDGVTPLDITGCTVFFTLNADNNPTTDSGAVIQKNVTVHTNPSAGQSAVILNNSDTQNLVPQVYYYDVQLKDVNGNIMSQKQDTFQVIADITRRIV